MIRRLADLVALKRLLLPYMGFIAPPPGNSSSVGL